MQMNGVKGIRGTDSHQVTGCLHDHHSVRKSGAGGMSSVINNAAEAAASQEEKPVWSLNDWFQSRLTGGKQALLRFWQSGNAASDSGAGEEVIATILADQAEAPNTNGDPNTAAYSGQSSQGLLANSAALAHASAAAATARTQQTPQENPYFLPLTDAQKQKEQFLQRIKIRFYALTGQLTRQFSGKDTFHAKQEQAKEDLRRHSRFRAEDREIECVLTDDSYLLDSYDRKGEYSKLSVKGKQ